MLVQDDLMFVFVPRQENKREIEDAHEAKCPRRHAVEVIELIEKEDRHQRHRDGVCPQPIAKEVVRHKCVDQPMKEEIRADKQARAVDREVRRLCVDKVPNRRRVSVAKDSCIAERHEPPRERPMHVAQQ